MKTDLKKLVFISSIASPYQVKYCYALQKYFNCEFWFYEYPAKSRPKWWGIELGDKCKILSKVIFKYDARYLSLSIISSLKKFNPDIVMLGGFTCPSNFIAYLWAIRKRKKTIVFTERSRTKNGILRKRTLIWRMIRLLYRNVDIVMVSAEDAASQFRDTFGFEDKVIAGRYAADLENYFIHPIRKTKDGLTLLFANRLTSIYQPLLAIQIFNEVLKSYPKTRLLLNADGELHNKCEAMILNLGLQNKANFLGDIKAWEDLPKIYEQCDILILPAKFSNGNFTILEAMASGMGIVISDQVLGIGKMIIDGANGFVSEPTISAFGNKINNYYRNENLFEKFGAYNKEIVKPYGMKGTAEFFNNIVQTKLLSKN